MYGLQGTLIAKPGQREVLIALLLENTGGDGNARLGLEEPYRYCLPRALR